MAQAPPSKKARRDLASSLHTLDQQKLLKVVAALIRTNGEVAKTIAKQFLPPKLNQTCLICGVDFDARYNGKSVCKLECDTETNMFQQKPFPRNGVSKRKLPNNTLPNKNLDLLICSSQEHHLISLATWKMFPHTVRGRGKVWEQASALRGRGVAASEQQKQPRNLSEPSRRAATKVVYTKALVLPARAVAPPTPNSSDDIGEDSQPLVLPPGPIAPAIPHSSDDIGEDSQTLVLPPGPTADIMAQIAQATPHSSDDIGEAQSFDDTDDIMGMCPATPDSSDDIGDVTAQISDDALSAEVQATAPFKSPHDVEEGNFENGLELEEDSAEKRKKFGKWFAGYRDAYMKDVAGNFENKAESATTRSKFRREWELVYRELFEAARSMSTGDTWLEEFTEGSPKKKAISAKQGESLWPLTLMSLTRL